MNTRYSLASLALLASAMAFADAPMQPEPLAPPASTARVKSGAYKPAPRVRLPAPTMNVTRLVRQSDGSLRLQCDERPNAQAKVQLPTRPVADGEAQ